jgi:hypothetical protein
MDMKEVVRRALRALDLPRDSGFEDVLAELEKLTGRKPRPAQRMFLRRRMSDSLKSGKRSAA